MALRTTESVGNGQLGRLRRVFYFSQLYPRRTLHLVATAIKARSRCYLRTNPTPEIRFDRDQPLGIA